MPVPDKWQFPSKYALPVPFWNMEVLYETLDAPTFVKL